jgi:GT2 family glycosyltransferase
MNRGAAARVHPEAAGERRRDEVACDAVALPLVTVIVPVYNDAGRLAGCLRALDAQTYPRDRFEVIVVDNGSMDRPHDVVAQFPGMRLLVERTPGSYAARHRALAAARGEILAFTDADCLPDAAWLERGVAELGRVPNCGLVGGRVDVLCRDATQPTLYDLYDHVFDFDQERFVARGGFACTANLFTTADVVRHVGGFDPSLRSGGDRDFGNRVRAAGYGLAFGGGAVVAHPARRSLRALLLKRLRVAGGHHDRARKRHSPLIAFLGGLGHLLLRNPAVGTLRTWRRAATTPLPRKLAVLGLYVLICVAEALERIRLQLGGQARR